MSLSGLLSTLKLAVQTRRNHSAGQMMQQHNMDMDIQCYAYS